MDNDFDFTIIWHLNQMKEGETYLLPVKKDMVLLITRNDDSFGIEQYKAINEHYPLSAGYKKEVFDDVCYSLMQMVAYIENMRD